MWQHDICEDDWAWRLRFPERFFLINLPLLPLLPPVKARPALADRRIKPATFLPFPATSATDPGLWGVLGLPRLRSSSRRKRRTDWEGCRVGRAWSCVLWSGAGSESEPMCYRLAGNVSSCQGRASGSMLCQFGRRLGGQPYFDRVSPQ